MNATTLEAVTLDDSARRDEPAAPQRSAAYSARAARARLRRVEQVAAYMTFGLWLTIFAAGILVDTTPYRRLISPAGAAALDGTAATNGARDLLPAWMNDGSVTALLAAWTIVLVCFLPLNLAWLCATASTLGALGSAANLSEDGAQKQSPDETNPYVSALLRGFCVYLFMTSGLLLLDDSPFRNASPGQYIRLAGFLSLFSFAVSYHPSLFSGLIVSVFQRIQMRQKEREGDSESQTIVQTREKEVVGVGTVPMTRNR